MGNDGNVVDIYFVIHIFHFIYILLGFREELKLI